MGWYRLKGYRNSVLNRKIKPFVTIGVCVKNCEDTLGAVIESILSQDFPHELMEVIFVDDGSIDSTLRVIHAFVPRIDFSFKIFSGKWRGLGAARQTVVENTRGKYIVWVDGDTILSKDYIAKQVEFMEKNPNVGITKGKCWDYKDLRSPKSENLVAFLEQMGFVTVDIKYGGKPTQKLPGTAGSTYKYEAIKQVGGFDICITGAGEDMDAAYRIKEDGWLIFLATDGVFYTKRKEDWNDLWRQYYWHGYGFHYVFYKNEGIGKLYDMLPPAGFLAGLLYSFVAYRLTNRKVVFLLPLHFVFKTTAFCLGFIKSHVNSYGDLHERR